jgi:hypothetical protein
MHEYFGTFKYVKMHLKKVGVWWSSFEYKCNNLVARK